MYNCCLLLQVYFLVTNEFKHVIEDCKQRAQLVFLYNNNCACFAQNFQWNCKLFFSFCAAGEETCQEMARLYPQEMTMQSLRLKM